MAFTFHQKVKFRHCDPAGIVFYPRYFEMTNDTVEAFFDEVLGLPFSELIPRGGVPTAQIATKFSAPSRMGDMLAIELYVTRVGRSSLEVRHEAFCGAELRFTTTSTLVHVNAADLSTAWPDRVRAILLEHTEGAS